MQAFWSAFTSRSSVLSLSLFLTISLLAAPAARSQTRVNDRDLAAMMRNLSADTKAFRPKFDDEVRKKSIIRGTSQAKDAVKLMETFAKQTSELPNRFKKDRNGGDSFRVVQATALQVDATISSAQLSAQLQDKWQKIRAEVNQIASAYNMPPAFGEGQTPSAAATAAPPATIAPVAIPFASGAEAHWLRISVFANVPIAGADIAVYDLKGKRIFQQQNATNHRGVYPARIPRLPRDFRVTATADGARLQDPGLSSMGRFTLSADVRNFDPATGVVYINPATTLTADVADKLPGHDLQRAQNLVRRLLVLPPGASLGAAMRQGPYYQSPYFSETLFLAEAGRDGGMDRFLNNLTPLAIRQSPPHSFTDGRVNPLAIGAAKFIATGLANGVLSWLGGQGIGWAVSSGNKAEAGATKGDIQQLQDKLADLQSSVDDLKSQMTALTQELLAELGEIKYQQLVVPAMLLSSQVNEVEDQLSFYAQECPAIPDDTDSGASAAQRRVDCAREKEIIEGHLNYLPIASAFGTLSDLIQPNGAFGHEGMVRLYSQSLARRQRFFRPADSTKMQEMFDYWYSVQVQAANLKVENMHARGFQNTLNGKQELRKFLGDATATPPTLGLVQTTFDAEQKLMYPAVPLNTVINTRDRTMWLVAPLIIRNDPWDGPPRRRIECGPPPSGSIWNQVTGPIKTNGLDWHLPTKAQAAALLDGWTGPNANTWLTEKTRAAAPETPTSPGFPDYLRNLLVMCQYTYRRERTWTSDPVSNGVYYTLDLQNGKLLNDHAGQAGISNFNYELLDRELNPGEQYYWY